MRILSPKERFLEDNAAVRAQLDRAASDEVRRTLDVALAEMVDRQRGDTLPDAARAHDRLQGAKEFIEIWLNLGEMPRVTTKKPTRDLDYDN